MSAVIFALNLEYLEGSFYSCATTGAPLPADVAGSATVEGCAKGSYTAATASVLSEIAMNEKDHVMVSQGFLPAAGATAAMGGPSCRHEDVGRLPGGVDRFGGNAPAAGLEARAAWVVDNLRRPVLNTLPAQYMLRLPAAHQHG